MVIKFYGEIGRKLCPFIYHVTFFHLNINYHFIWIYKVRKWPKTTVNYKTSMPVK